MIREIPIFLRLLVIALCNGKMKANSPFTLTLFFKDKPKHFEIN